MRCSKIKHNLSPLKHHDSCSTRMRQHLIKQFRYTAYLFIGLFCGYWLLQVTTCCSFHAPTESMTPTIMPGDYGLVNKWKIGARIFNIPDAIEGKKVTVHRLPGYGAIERNDIAVFNYPLVGKDTIGMNMRKYYCKRIVALPGDTLKIRNCRYLINSGDEQVGYAPAQIELSNWLQGTDNPEERMCFYTWPYDSVMSWNVRDFGPLVVPGKGTTIRMTREATVLYGRYIAWEQQCPTPTWHDGCAWIADKRIDYYRFTENYYFTAGDRAENSADSRYWGLLPEPMIVGTTNFIWDSKDVNTGTRRWNRICTDIIKP